ASRRHATVIASAAIASASLLPRRRAYAVTAPRCENTTPNRASAACRSISGLIPSTVERVRERYRCRRRRLAGEERQVRLTLAAQDGEIDLDAADPARLGERARLRLDRLGGEDAATGVELDALEVPAELLDRVDRADALDLDRDPLSVPVAAHQIDRTDVGRP